MQLQPLKAKGKGQQVRGEIAVLSLLKEACQCLSALNQFPHSYQEFQKFPLQNAMC